MMAMLCRKRALEEKERSEEWLAQAEMWNQLAGAAIGHPCEEKIVNRSSEPGILTTAANDTRLKLERE
jgi:hypothetical protein